MKRSLLITLLVSALLLINCISLYSSQSAESVPPRPAGGSCLLAGPCEKGHSGAAEVYLPAVHLPGNY